MKSQKGFISIAFISIFPLLVAAAFATYFSYSFLKSDLAVLNVCRSEQLETHNQVAKQLKKLLGMNSSAIKLRLREKLAEQKLLLAMASGNPIAIAAAETHLAHVKALRLKLAFRQNVAIQSANTNLKIATYQISNSLKREWGKHMQQMAPWISSRLEIQPSPTPLLAIRPDFPDIAPVYEPVPNFEEQQSWVHSWQLQLEVKSLHFNGRFQRSCSTSLYQDKSDWIGRLKGGRYLSKPLF